MKTLEIEQNTKKPWTKNKKNKLFLGFFLGLIALTVLLKIIVTFLWDTGYYGGETHLWYWQDDDVMNILKKAKWDTNAIHGSDLKHEMAKRAITHPYFFWSLTQFTWQTTLIVFVLITFRFFMYDDKIPKWLKWTHSQRTLSIVTMYDIIVCLVFWSALAKTFNVSLGSTDKLMNGLINISTILVHAVIPAIMVIYSLICLLFLSEASRLSNKFIWIGIIYPVIYILFYIMMCLVWRDPYPVSSISSSNSFKDIWIALLSIIGILFGLWGMIYVHNLLLFTFNKKYRYEKDLDDANEKRAKIHKLRAKIERKEKILETEEDAKKIKKIKLAIIKYKLAIQKAEIKVDKHETRSGKTKRKYLTSEIENNEVINVVEPSKNNISTTKKKASATKKKTTTSKNTTTTNKKVTVKKTTNKKAN